ncbi:MAG TPA: hypothetical protein PLP27_10980 [Crocinitomicaceae bacterium]|nr:hypothetical protein [Crocinitomicaceae bacterium]
MMLQYGGALSGLFEFMNSNDLKDLDISEGEYIAPEVLNADVASSLNPLGLKVPTVVTGEYPSGYYLADDEDNFIVDDEGYFILVN